MSATVTPNSRHTYAKVRQLRVLADGGWQPLPHWAQFLTSLGAGVRSAEQDRLTVAVALPTQSAAAAFVLAGIALARTCEYLEFDVAAHFEYLSALPVGTPVEIHNYGQHTRQRGRLRGRAVISGIKYIRIQTSEVNKGNDETLFPAERVSRIAVLQDGKTMARQFGKRTVTAATPLIKALMDPETAFRYVNGTNLETIVIGRRSTIIQELSSIHVATDSVSSDMVPGTLQELVRLHVRDQQPYQSRVFPPGNRGMNRVARQLTPRVVVFDGASGFLRSRHHWRATHWVVLLDRTDVRFEEAAEVINGLYLERSGEARLSRLPQPPLGVELCLFSR